MPVSSSALPVIQNSISRIVTARRSTPPQSHMSSASGTSEPSQNAKNRMRSRATSTPATVSCSSDHSAK